MSIKLDDFELNTRAEDNSKSIIAEVRRVSKIGLLDRRRLIEHPIVSTHGSIIEDSGRHAIGVVIEGEVIGEKAKDGIALLRTKYRKGTPLPFESDISLIAYVKKVIVESLQITSIASFTNYFRYYMILREFVEPLQQGEAPPQDAQLKSTIYDIEGTVLDYLGRAVANAPLIIKSDQNEYNVSADENGVYFLDDVPDGTYSIKVDDTKPGFEKFSGSEKRVVVKKRVERLDMGAGSRSRPTERNKPGIKFTEATVEQPPPNSIVQLRSVPIDKMAYWLAWIDWKLSKLENPSDLGVVLSMDFDFETWEEKGFILITSRLPKERLAAILTPLGVTGIPFSESPPRDRKDILDDAVNVRNSIHKEIQALRHLRKDIEVRGGKELKEYNESNKNLLQKLLVEFAYLAPPSNYITFPVLTAYDATKAWERRFKISNPPSYDIFLLYQKVVAEIMIEAIDKKIQNNERAMKEKLDDTGWFDSKLDQRTKSSISRGFGQVNRNLEEEKERLTTLKASIKVPYFPQSGRRGFNIDNSMRSFILEAPKVTPPGNAFPWWVASMTVDFIPVAGEIKSAQEAITGIDIITGQKLDASDRVLAAIGAIPVLGMLGRLGKKAGTLRKARTGIVKLADNADEVLLGGAKNLSDAPIMKVFPDVRKNHGLDAYMTDQHKIMIKDSSGVKEAVNVTAIAPIDKKGRMFLTAVDGEVVVGRIADSVDSAGDVEKAAAKLDDAGDIGKSNPPSSFGYIEPPKMTTKVLSRVSPDIDAFEAALKKALDSMASQAKGSIDSLEFSGKSAKLIFSGGAGRVANDIDVTIKAKNEVVKKQLFDKIAENYKQYSGRASDPRSAIEILANDKIVVWGDWMKRMDGIDPAADGLRSRRVVEAIDNFSILTPDGTLLHVAKEGNLPQKLTHKEVGEYAQEALEKYKEKKSNKWVIKVYDALLRGELKPGVKLKIRKKDRELMEAALREILTDAKHITDEKAVREFLERVGRLAPKQPPVKLHKQLQEFVERNGKNAVRTFLELKVEKSKILHPDVAKKIPDDAWDDFTKWWDRLDEKDMAKVFDWFDTPKVKKMLAQEDLIIVSS